ncbi:hypothetical protein [Stutzerimonas stutzeri]|uniref:hypothetical protein n=1 Tax=Stutzerimonas stutzeri TaxID=316 RepID=UPI000AE42E7A|nr:hypothetical protein [Stutzerimonas stutzeri]
MARFFPVRSQCQLDTPGERRFAERLEKLLEDDYLCWSNVPVGPKARYRLRHFPSKSRQPGSRT